MAPTTRRILSLTVDSIEQVLMVHPVETMNQSVNQSVGQSWRGTCSDNVDQVLAWLWGREGLCNESVVML